MADLNTPKDRTDKLDGAVQSLRSLPKEIKDIPEFRGAIENIQVKIEDLKTKVHDENYDQLKDPVQEDLKKLYDDTKPLKTNLEKIKAVEKYIESIDADIASVGAIKEQIDSTKLLLQNIREDLRKYDSNKEDINDRTKKIEMLLPVVKEQTKKMKEAKIYIDSIKGDSLKNTDIKNQIDLLRADIERLVLLMGTDGYKVDDFNVSIKKLYETLQIRAEEDAFLSEIDKKLRTPLSEYDQKILKELPGKNDDEKKWNYNLLNAYSDAFATQNVPAGKTAGAFTSENKSTMVSLMGSLRIAEGGNGKNGKDVIDQQKVSTPKGNPLDIGVKKGDRAGDLVQAVTRPNTGVKHIEDVAQYANNINTVTPIYFSLVREHYLTMLVQKDRYYNTGASGRDTLPEHQKKSYDAVANNSPSQGPVKFTWEGLDSDGLDWSFKDDTYTFENIADKKSFLEGTMKLLPFLDTLGKKFQEKEFLGFFDKAGKVVGGGLDIMDWLGNHLMIPSFVESVLKVLTAVGNPVGLALGSALSLWSRGEWQTNLPYNIFIIRTLLYALRSITRLPVIRSFKPLLFVGPKFKEIEEDLKNKYPHRSLSDKIGYKRPSVQEKVVSDVALPKLEKTEQSFKQYKISRDIILQRQLGPVTLPVGNKGETITLGQITPEFAQALLQMHDYIIQEEYYRQYQEYRRAGDTNALQEFSKIEGGNFVISDKTCVKLIENVTVHSNPFMQVLTGNTMDTSRLRGRGPGRILRLADPNIKEDISTKWNMPKVVADITLGKLSRAVTSRLVFLGKRIDPSLIYYEQVSLPTLTLGRPNEGLAMMFLNDLIQAREADSSILPESLTEQNIRGEVKELLKNGQIFNHDSERKLLEDFAKSVKGIVKRSAWEYTVARLGFACRGDGTPNPTEIVGLDSLDGMNAHIATNQLSNQDSRGKVETAYKKIKNNESLTPKEIMELGKLTGSRVDLPGAADTNDFIVGNGRTEMDALENKYYIADLAELHDDTKFTTKYEEWFFKNAKSCSAQYDFEKHTKLLMSQKKLQEYMKKGGELELALKDGSEHDHESALKKKMRSLSINPDTPGFTQIFKGDYDSRVKVLNVVRGGTESKAITDVEVEMRKLHQEMKDGTLGDIDTYKTQLAQKLRGIKPSKVALEFINRTLGGGAAHVDLEPAITAYCADAEVKFEARIANIIRLMNDTSIGWEARYAAVADYRQYGESSEERGNDRGRKIVDSTYDAIHEAIKSGTPAEQYMKYESYCAAINPEEGVSDLRKKNPKEATFRKAREKAIDDYRTHAQEAVDGIFDIKRYPTFEQLESNKPIDIKEIKAEYGELSEKMIKNAETRFKAIEAGHQAVRILCDSVARGSKTRKTEIDKALETITTMHPEYVKLYLAQASRAVDEARDQYMGRSATDRTGSEIPPPENTPPKDPTLDTPPPPESTSTAPDFKALKKEIEIDPTLDGFKERFDATYTSCTEPQKAELLDLYIKRLQEIAQNPDLTLKKRQSALSVLKDPVVKGKMKPEAQKEIDTFVAETRINFARQKNAKNFATLLKDVFSGVTTPEGQQRALVELITTHSQSIDLGQSEIIENYLFDGRTNPRTFDIKDFTACIQELSIHAIGSSESRMTFDEAYKSFQKTLETSGNMRETLKKAGINLETIMEKIDPRVRERVEAKTEARRGR